jgi:preprotein translocase subunit SecF
VSLLSRLYHGETKIDFIGKRRLWFAVSAGLVLLSVGSMFLRPTENPCRSPLPQGMNCGIEFNGGLSVRARVEDPALQDANQDEVFDAVRSGLERFDVGDAQLQMETQQGDRYVLVQTRVVDQQQRAGIRDAVADTVGAQQVDLEQISAKWGGEITRKAIRALVVFLVIILLFISVRFEWKMAVAAIVALGHDLLITAGVYSLVGFEVTPSTVIAILTILGYSLYDTVVVFDKVEENTNQLAATGRTTYQDAANLAMNQVFMRSLNTSLATLLPVAALLFVGAGLLGAATLEDLALALFVGILVGTYSSIFVATPVLSLWKEKEPKYRSVREKVLRDAERGKIKPLGAEADEERERVGATVTSGPGGRRSPSRPRPGSKKAKRRRRR